MEDLFLRPATINDSKLLFDWRNEYDTRMNSFNQKEITWKEHSSWLSKELNNPNESIFILIKGNESIGQVRLSKENNEVTISYSIDKSFRGQGFGNIILQLAEKEAYRKHGKVQLVALVLKENVASQMIFKKNDYLESFSNTFFQYSKTILN